MLNLKKTAVAVLAFGSSAAFAGTMGPVCTAGNVTIPCESTAWDVGAQALYLKPYYSGPLGWFGTTETGSGATLSDVGASAQPAWAWGFQIEGSYHFGTGNDIDVNWYHLGGDNTNQRNTAGTFVFDQTSTVVDTVNQSIKPTWDAVNVEFGQHVDFSEMKNIRVHGGLQFARVSTGINITGTDTDVITDVVQPFNGNYNASYNGVGGRVGADMAYDWGNGVGMYAKGAAAILAGTSKYSSAFVDNQSGAIGFPRTASGSRTAIVPELETKLGLTYDYAMAQGDLTLDVGWMWFNYFNAQTAVAASNTRVDSDFGATGLYFGLKWLGSIV